MIKIIRVGERKKAKDASAVYTLISGRTYSVGRKGCDISFEDDSSISRSHATIQIEHPQPNVTTPSLTPTVVITDSGSKFGTYVNAGIESKTRISLREPHILSMQDRFRFGLQWNEYKIEYTPLIVTTSTLKNPSKLKESLSILGGHLVSDWREESNFLIMESILMTMKVVAALLAAKPIVTPSFFDDYIRAVEAGIGQGGEYELTFPSPGDYLPPLHERSLQGRASLFHPDPARSRLFVSKTFLFLNEKALKPFGGSIQAGGGEVGLLTSKATPVVTDSDTIVVGEETEFKQCQDGKVQALIDAYWKSGKRIVPEKELGLAALYKDLSGYCNPSATCAPSSSQLHPMTKSQVGETQEAEHHIIYTEQTLAQSFIPETQKRNRDEDEGPSGSKRRKEVSSFGNHGLESPEVKKEKRLAALFGMDESDDEQGSSSAIPNAEDKPSTSTTSAFLHSTQQCIPSSTEGFSRSQALQSSLCVGASSSTRNTDSSGFRILPTQSDAEDEIVPSGASNFVPETPESLIRIGTLQAQPQQLGTSSGSREKRKQEDQDEVRDSIPKKRRVLTNNNEPVEAQKTDGNAIDQPGDIHPIGFSFASLVISTGRNPELLLAEAENWNNGSVNFKKFRKVSPIFTQMPTRPIPLVPHDEFQDGRTPSQVRVEGGQVEPFVSAGSGSGEPALSRHRQDAHATVPTRRSEIIEDEFSFE